MLPRAFVRAIPGVLLFATLLAFSAIASASTAEPAAEPTEPSDASQSDSGDSGGGWGPIIGACFGVMFGGVLAVWQIRGMKERR